LTIVTKNPTANTNPDSWTNPQYAYVEDVLCANKLISPGGPDAHLYLSGYGFAIPVGSTINKIWINIKGGTNTAYTGTYTWLFFEFTGLNWVIQATNAGAMPCSSTTYLSDKEVPKDALTWPPDPVAALNSEAFNTYVEAHNPSPAQSIHRVDAVYIKVDYTPPAVGPKCFGDALTWIQAHRPHARMLPWGPDNNNNNKPPLVSPGSLRARR
jgi:hypothetical protein